MKSKTQLFAAILFTLSIFGASLLNTNTYSPGWKIVAKNLQRESKTNSVTTEQDFATLFTIGAGELVEGKIYKVTIHYQLKTGTSSATIVHYVDLGSTRAIITNAANLGDAVTRSPRISFTIVGTEAASATAEVEVGLDGPVQTTVVNNTIEQPITVATDASIPIVAGVQWSATGSTEILELRWTMTEESN